MSRPPNLLWLISDQQRADTVGRATLCQTPHLNELGARGTRFTRCYAPNPICSPTRASLMTGQLPHTHGMVDCTHTVEPYRADLRRDLPFWPQRLKAAGYRTGYFGKWHIERSNRLENYGFDTYDVEQYHQQLGLVERDEEMQIRRAVAHKGYRDFLLYGVVDMPPEETAEHRLYSDGIGFLEEAAREPDQPWALFLSSEAPHDPFVVPRTYYERYDPAAIPKPENFEDDLADRPYIYRRLQAVWESLEWPDFAQAMACYYGLCSLVDDQVGRVLAAVERLGQIDDTLVIFLSDHGDYMGAHRLLLKGVPAFEGAYRSPLILSGPGVPSGRLVDNVVSLMDVPATMVALTTGDMFATQGRSLLPLLADDPRPWTDEAFAEFHGQRFFYTQRTLWRDHHKYVFNGFDVDELYDLAADPHEMHNLAADAEYQGVLEDMAARMWDIIRETGDFNMYEAQYGMFRFAPVGPESE